MEKDIKRVLVTGASRGIGFAIAEMYRNNGYEVVTPSRSELNLTDKESIDLFLQKNKDICFDVLINNAGVNNLGEVDVLGTDELDEMIKVNLLAPIFLIRGIVPNMKKQKFGRIVNIGSIWGLAGKPGRVGYAATKHGVHGVTQTLAVELAPYNILINTVCPGFTLTDLTFKNNTKEQLDEIASYIPMGRLAEPKEQARTVFFLGSEENTYITGQQIAVDGGFTAR